MINIMTTESKKAVLTDENLAESAKLRELWEKRKHLHGLNQTEFGHEYDIGTQATVSHCLNGTMAISLKAATGFAQGLRCNVADFSPRLAALSGAVTKTSLNALISDLGPQLGALAAANQPYCQPVANAAPSDYAAMLGKVFDGLPNNEELRTHVFMACVHIIRTAFTQQAAPQPPAPGASGSEETPS